jgi:hypothetical protein
MRRKIINPNIIGCQRTESLRPADGVVVRESLIHTPHGQARYIVVALVREKPEADFWRRPQRNPRRHGAE